jgi:predicted N-acetyltransferase YhbS
MRLAFGTFMGVAEPENLMADVDSVHTRWLADPTAAFAAELDGEIVGSNFAADWGSVAFFGPLTVRPDLWDCGIGKLLMQPVLDLFNARQVKLAGLYTFAESEKHVGFYQRFDFWPRFLTAIMSKPVTEDINAPSLALYSEVPELDRETCLNACRQVTNAVFAGLDLRTEIRAVARQHLGDTVLLWDGSSLAGLAVCHRGAGTEAGSGNYYVKFAAVRPGDAAAAAFERLLDCCEKHASSCGLTTIDAGVNMARHEAYRALLARGFRARSQGVAMHRPNEAGYNRPGVYVIDDWR